MSQKKLIFYTVKDPSSKVNVLLRTLDQHLTKKNPISVLLPDEKSMHFVSELLWSYPKESFRPHSTPFAPQTPALIKLLLPPFVKLDYFIFNLSLDYMDPDSPCTLYELEDLSTPYKAALFQKKFSFYKKACYAISSGLIS